MTERIAKLREQYDTRVVVDRSPGLGQAAAQQAEVASIAANTQQAAAVLHDELHSTFMRCITGADEA